MTTQVRNNEMVNLLRADFQPRYEPNFAWEHAVSAYLNLPGLRSFYPFTSVNESGNLIDISGQGRLATNNLQPVFYTENLITYAKFNGSNQFFSRADEAGLDLLGNEAYNVAALQGMTVMAWVRIAGFGANYRGIVNKFSTTNTNSNYFLGHSNAPTNAVNFTVYSGANLYSVETQVIQNKWYFLCGRFDPSTAIYIKANTVENTNVVNIPATLNNSTNAFQIANATGLGLLNGDVTLVATCAAFVPSAMVEAIFQQTRAMFNV